MLALPAHDLDREDASARKERLGVIAQAISEASMHATCSSEYALEDCRPVWPLRPIELGVLLLTQAYAESRLARNVHEGNCRPYECDPIRNAMTGVVSHRARSLWQIHHIAPIESEWHLMQGSDLQSTTAAAWAAAKLLSRGYRACRSISGAIASYAGLRSCYWSQADSRARMYVSLRERATRLERQTEKPSPPPPARARTCMRQ
jgi:hypothetical protein